MSAFERFCAKGVYFASFGQNVRKMLQTCSVLAVGTLWILYVYPKPYKALERFPIECRKTKTKVITLTNHNRCKQHNEPIRIQIKIHVTGAKYGKMRAAKIRLVLVWIPIVEKVA